MKRSKNIFNTPIASESLLQDEENKDFKVDGKSIASNWLVGVDPKDYRRYILSSLELSSLSRDLDEYRQGSPNKILLSNHFKIGELKKKIQNFELLQTEPVKPLGEQALLKNQPPPTQNMLVQKISGFFNSSYSRKCKIEQKQLYVQSQKDQKLPWIRVGISNYAIERQMKSKLLNKDEFKEFTWLPNFNERLLLSAADLKPYAVYGKQEELNRFQRYFQVENLQVKKLVVFEKLDVQLKQKIIFLFGKKVRFYDHSIRLRRAEKEAHYSALHTPRNGQDQRNQEYISNKKLSKDFSSQIGAPSSVGQQSDSLVHSGVFDPNILLDKPNMISDEAKTPEKMNKSKISQKMGKSVTEPIMKQKKIPGSDIFKLKLKSSTVFYDQIEEPLRPQDNADVNIDDLKLNIKKQIGMSDVDEQSENRSQISMSLDGQSHYKVRHKEVVQDIHNSEQYNISIHQVTSHDAQTNRNAVQFDELDNVEIDVHSAQYLKPRNNEPGTPSSTRSHQFENKDDILNANTRSRSLKRKKSLNNNVFDQNLLQKQRNKEDSESVKSSIEITMQRSITGGKQQFSKFKKKVGEVEIVERLKPTTVHYILEEIEMLMPYHLDQISFQIIQVDFDCEMQGRIVACGRTTGILRDQKREEPRTHYSVEGGHHFTLNSESDHFIFVLQEDNKCHYLHFDLNPSPKYQRNCSQLLQTKLDRQGYPFACALILHQSPTPVVLRDRLTTVQFMQRYLQGHQNYDFKHDFIDDMKRRYLIKREWNKKLINSSVKTGNSESFAKAVFLGMTDSIFNKLKKGVNYNPKQLFRFTQNELKLMEENIMSAGVMDSRTFMKSTDLIRYITESRYNQYFEERLEHVYVYFLNRYGNVRNLAVVFVKQILSKLESLIILGRTEEEIFAIVSLYFEVEYQIDNLFLEISKYFKK